MASKRGRSKRAGPRRGGSPGLVIGGVLGILAGWSIGGTIGGPVGSNSGYIGAFLGFLVGISAGMFLGYWIGAGIGSVTKRAKPRQRRPVREITLAAIDHAGALVPMPKRQILRGQGCAVIGIVCGLLMLFSVVLLPAIVLAVLGIGLAIQPTATVPWPGRICGVLLAAICLFWLGVIGRAVKPSRRKRFTGKEPVLLECRTAQGPGTLTVTPSYVALVRSPLPGRVAPELIMVPRTEISTVVRYPPSSVAVAIASYFGVISSITIHTRDGKAYGVDMPIWEVRKLIRTLCKPPS